MNIHERLIEAFKGCAFHWNEMSLHTSIHFEKKHNVLWKEFTNESHSPAQSFLRKTASNEVEYNLRLVLHPEEKKMYDLHTLAHSLLFWLEMWE